MLETHIQRYHFIGVCGVAMAQVAAWLKQNGKQVTGSDQGVYPPMSDFLEAKDIEVLTPYRASNINSADAVIIGNSISRGNPEVEAVLKKRLPFYSLPELIHQQILSDKYPIVVAGTHGKTTTTAALAHLLKNSGSYGGCMIGGLPVDWNQGFEVSAGRWFAMEGDEYDTAFFDKRPKFLHYQPQVVIINSIEFDHADIYATLDDIITQFRYLLRLVPENGRLIINGDSAVLQKLAEESPCPVVSFGLEDAAHVKAEDVAYSSEGMQYKLRLASGETRDCRTPLWGEHQLYNLLAAAAAAEFTDMDADDICSAIAEFRGVKRRLELKFSDGHHWIYDDFAHHPTAVRATLFALRARHPGLPIYAAFEPRSNTMVRRIFQQELTQALSDADGVAIGRVHRSSAIPPDDRLNVEQIADVIRVKGKEVFHHGNVRSIARWLKEKSDREAVIVALSSGSFDGLVDALIEIFA